MTFSSVVLDSVLLIVEVALFSLKFLQTTKVCLPCFFSLPAYSNNLSHRLTVFSHFPTEAKEPL